MILFNVEISGEIFPPLTKSQHIIKLFITHYDDDLKENLWRRKKLK